MVMETANASQNRESSPGRRIHLFLELQNTVHLPLFGIGFSFLTEKFAGTQVGEPELGHDLRALSALATAGTAEDEHDCNLFRRRK